MSARVALIYQAELHMHGELIIRAGQWRKT